MVLIMKKLLLLVMLALWIGSVSAQKNSEKTGALLWKISGNGLKKPSYVFGTHHIFPLSFLDSVPGLKKAFDLSEQVVVELIMSDMANIAVAMQAASMMPQDTTWQMLLSKEDYAFVDEQLKALFGAGLETFAALKPAMVNTLYSANIHQKMFPNVKPDEAFDVWFQQQAIKKGLPVIGLEQVQDQLALLFESSSLSRQANDLLCMLRNKDYAENMAKNYPKADFKGLSTQLHNICPMSADQQMALIDNRNKNWLEQLPAIMSKKSTFVAVGCLHLVGEVGLLSGLQRLGYKVEPVRK